MCRATEVPRECGIRSTLSFFSKKTARRNARRNARRLHEGESHKSCQMMSGFFIFILILINTLFLIDIHKVEQLYYNILQS